MTKKRITFAIVVLVIIGLFLFWPSGQSNVEQTSEASQLKYPMAWRKLNLPKLPGARLTDINGSDLRKGIDFEFEVDLPANEVGDFYEEEFADRDFNYYEPNDSDSENYANDFNGGDVGISVDVSPGRSAGGSSRVRIYIEKEARQRLKSNNASLRFD